MTPDDLIKQQDELQKEGKEVLEKLGILKVLSKFGKPKTVGSFESGLMTWRDIDIEIEKEIEDKEYWETVNELFYDDTGLKYLTLIDFRNSKNPNTPKGLYIGIKYWLESREWKIDVWFISPRKQRVENYNDWIKDKLNDQNRKIILGIKSQVQDNPKYRKSIFSVDIYKAVIENGVKDLEGFREYLNQTGRSLD